MAAMSVGVLYIVLVCVFTSSANGGNAFLGSGDLRQISEMFP